MVKKKLKKTKQTAKGGSFRFADIATLGPLGHQSTAPGTLGSLAALPLAYILNQCSFTLLYIAVIALFIIGLKSIQQYTANLEEKDPGCVIIDEVVGQMIPFLVIVPEFLHWYTIFAAFALFRFFDICKFGPVRYWDRRKNPLGVMMDDVTAGIFAGFLISMAQVLLVQIYQF